MPNKIDWLFHRTGKKREEIRKKTPTVNQTSNKRIKQLKSKYKLRNLGNGNDGDVFISEEERPHTHLIGAPRQGKSKFIEYLIRDDIRRGLGVCLLDPTTGGQTVYDVLKYCCSIGHKKVCIIDPYHRFQYQTVVGFNPFVYSKKNPNPLTNHKMRGESIVKLMDTTRTLFGIKDPASTARIERYLPAVFNVLYNARSPISEARFFTKKLYENQRKEILSCTPKYDDSRLEIEEAFNNPRNFSDFQSTVGRLQKFFKETLGLMFSVNHGVDFMKLVAEGWVILVNLDTSAGFDIMDSRLLGTLIINEVQSAINILNKKNRHKTPKPYYLYIDEAGEYANQKLAKALALYQKTGLKVTIGHQYFAQFEDKVVRDAVLSTPDLRLMFNLPNSEDRLVISNLFYGGDIKPLDANWANADIPKQQAVIKVGKTKAQRIKIPDVPSIDVPIEELDSYIKSLFAEQDWSYSVKVLQEKLNNQDINETYTETRTDTRPTQTRTTPDSKSDSEASVPDGGINVDKWKSLSKELPVSKQHAPKDGKKKTT